MSNVPAVSVISPVTAEQLAAYMGLPYTITVTDALLDPFILTACEVCVSYTNRDLLQRTWTYSLDEYPRIGGSEGIVPIPSKLKKYIALPTTPVSSITSITVDGVAYTDFTNDLTTTPARVYMNSYNIEKIVITYIAGYANAAAVPSSIKMGIMAMASYMYDNKGCDAGDAMAKSGARAMWGAYILYAGGL